MYTNNQNTKTYLFDFYKNRYVVEFDCEEDLINFLGQAFYKSFWEGYRNHYFDEINCNGNDMVNFAGIKNGEDACYIRRYMFIDENNRIIDVRNYYQEAFDRYKKGMYKYRYDNVCDDLQYGDILVQRWSKQTFRYRIDPVPNIRHGGGYRGYIRHMKTTQELRQNADVEYEEFVRPKRRKLPTCWDDIPRGLQRSWKKQSKKRKQWM